MQLLDTIKNAFTSPKYRAYRVGTAVAVATVLIGGIATGEIDLPFVEQQIQNHEERITTIEGQVGLPSVTPVPTPVTTSAVNTSDTTQVPQVATQPAATPVLTVTPAPVTAVSYVEYIGHACSSPSRYVVTYSNGSTNSEPYNKYKSPSFDLSLPHTSKEDPDVICTQ